MSGREIKFRVWDKERGRFYEPTYTAYRGELEELLLSPSGDLSMRTLSGMNHESLFPDRFELNQYTGLKDKNGREIYEGDLVLYNRKTKESGIQDWTTSPMPVVWDSSKARFDLEGNQEWGMIYTGGYEVIGNIYENPELLGKEASE